MNTGDTMQSTGMAERAHDAVRNATDEQLANYVANYERGSINVQRWERGESAPFTGCVACAFVTPDMRGCESEGYLKLYCRNPSTHPVLHPVELYFEAFALAAQAERLHRAGQIYDWVIHEQSRRAMESVPALVYHTEER